MSELIFDVDKGRFANAIGKPGRVICSVNRLPTPSGLCENSVYFLTSSHDSYLHGHFYKCVKVNNVLTWVDCQVGENPVGNFSNIRCVTSGTTVRIKFLDPSDLVLNNVVLAKWSKSVVVRKLGSYPTSIDDGTVVLTNTVRNQYSSSAFIDTIENGTTWYYGFFSVTEDGVINDNVAEGLNSAVTANITENDILDALRSGEINEILEAGDAISIKVKTQNLQSDENHELYVSGFNKCEVESKPFVRDSSFDTASAHGWKSSIDSTIVYTNAGNESSNDDVFYDDALTITTGKIASLSGDILNVNFLRTLTFEWRNTVGGYQFDPAKKEKAKTFDTVYRPERYFGYSAHDYDNHPKQMFYQDNLNLDATGYDRVFYRCDGTFLVKWNNSRWELYSCSSSTHTATNLVDYQTTPSADPWDGVWNTGATWTKLWKYYSDSACTTELVEGVDFTAGDPITGDVYVVNPFYSSVDSGYLMYGSNRYTKSPLFRYLNAEGTGWFEPLDEFDNTPGYAGYAGFMDRLPEGFKRIMATTKYIVAKNCITMQGGVENVSSKLFLLSNTEVNLGAVNGISEGSVLDIWRSATNEQRIKRNLSNAAQYWWLRSPSVGYGNDECSVYTSGALNNNNANNTNGVAPDRALCVGK